MLFIGVLAMALSTMIALFSATLATLRYDLLPGTQSRERGAAGEAKATRHALAAGGALCLVILVAAYLLEEHLGITLTSSGFLALVIAFGRVAISIISAFAIVYFRFPLRKTCFWLIFITLMLPVEVRILPTYQVAANLKLVDTYAGLTLPLIASATATFLFRQFFLTIPDEYAEAARIDGAGPMRFFRDVVLPLSRTNIAALFVIMFIFGWNQYLWPLLVTTQESMYTTVIGIKRMIPGGDAAAEWHLVMATAMLAMLPPALVVLLMQKWFVKGLVETEK